VLFKSNGVCLELSFENCVLLPHLLDEALDRRKLCDHQRICSSAWTKVLSKEIVQLLGLFRLEQIQSKVCRLFEAVHFSLRTFKCGSELLVLRRLLFDVT